MTAQQMADVAARHGTKLACAMLRACAEAGATVPDVPPPKQYEIRADSPEWGAFLTRKSNYGTAFDGGPAH